jgi:HD superfamily phosphohydrolase
MPVYKRIRVFPDRDLRATRFELAAMDTRTFQRLRDVRQLGNACVTFPTAEHSRFSHSLGTLYWVTKMLSYLRENHFAEDIGEQQGSATILKNANTALKQRELAGLDENRLGLQHTFFEQLIRLWALLHDITHLPFGHTIEDQARLLPRHDEDPERIRYVFNSLLEEVKQSPHISHEPNGDERVMETLLRCCRSIHYLSLRLKKKMPLVADEAKRWQEFGDLIDPALLPYMTIVHDLVSNTICADLLDYLHRDSLMSGMPWSVDKALFCYLRLMRVRKELNGDLDQEAYRSGVVVGRTKLRHDVVTAVLALLRARYDMTEKIYYHHTKCAADAILEKAIRSLPDNRKLSWQRIIEERWGDEGLLTELERDYTPRPLFPEAAPDEPPEKSVAAGLVEQLRARRFHKAVYRLRRGSDWKRQTAMNVKMCTQPDYRSTLESKIVESIPELVPGDVIVSCLPQEMQLKEAEAIIEWIDGEHLPLKALPQVKQYLSEVISLTERYYDLWNLTVYLHPEKSQFVSAVATKCERLFEHANDPLLEQYLEQRHPAPYKVKNVFTGIVDASEAEAARMLGAAFRGVGPEDESRIHEVVDIQLERRLTERRKGRGSGRRKTDKPDNSTE